MVKDLLSFPLSLTLSSLLLKVDLPIELLYIGIFIGVNTFTRSSFVLYSAAAAKLHLSFLSGTSFKSLNLTFCSTLVKECLKGTEVLKIFD